MQRAGGLDGASQMIHQDVLRPAPMARSVTGQEGFSRKCLLSFLLVPILSSQTFSTVLPSEAQISL